MKKRRRTVLKNNPSALVQYLTIPCACIGSVQVCLLNVELVSDMYTVQSRLQTIKVADNYLVGPVFQCFSAVLYGFHVNLNTMFQCSLGSFFIKKKQPTKKPQTGCTSCSPLSYRQNVHTWAYPSNKGSMILTQQLILLISFLPFFFLAVYL